jgi:hypothetical protein
MPADMLPKKHHASELLCCHVAQGAEHHFNTKLQS